jgi:hypothetical protein
MVDVGVRVVIVDVDVDVVVVVVDIVFEIVMRSNERRNKSGIWKCR